MRQSQQIQSLDDHKSTLKSRQNKQKQITCNHKSSLKFRVNQQIPITHDHISTLKSRQNQQNKSKSTLKFRPIKHDHKIEAKPNKSNHKSSLNFRVNQQIPIKHDHISTLKFRENQQIRDVCVRVCVYVCMSHGCVVVWAVVFGEGWI